MNSQGLILTPLGALYTLATRARLALYRRGALQIHKAGAPVISVGNITTGGTGKTPLVAWIARALRKDNHRVCILTRGYGRPNPSQRVVVSDGETIFSEVTKSGDEPRLLAESLLGVASVVADADRVASARWAIENLKSNVFVLDDGFQHLRIARDLNLLVIDAMNPWGGRRLLPRGRLREPLSELARADCLIITRSDQHPDIDSLCAEAKYLSGGRPLILSRTRTRALSPLTQNSLSSSESTHHSSLITHHSPPPPVAAFCAIGNPASFFAHLRNDGHTPNFTRAFPDHHFYTQTDVDALVREAQEAGARSLVTTMKDAVKLRELRFELPCYVLEIELEFDDEGKLISLLRKAVSAGNGKTDLTENFMRKPL